MNYSLTYVPNFKFGETFGGCDQNLRSLACLWLLPKTAEYSAGNSLNGRVSLKYFASL